MVSVVFKSCIKIKKETICPFWTATIFHMLNYRGCHKADLQKPPVRKETSPWAGGRNQKWKPSLLGGHWTAQKQHKIQLVLWAKKWKRIEKRLVCCLFSLNGLSFVILTLQRLFTLILKSSIHFKVPWGTFLCGITHLKRIFKYIYIHLKCSVYVVLFMCVCFCLCCCCCWCCCCCCAAAMMADGVLPELNLNWLERSERENDRKRQSEGGGGAGISPLSEASCQWESLT